MFENQNIEKSTRNYFDKKSCKTATHKTQIANNQIVSYLKVYPQ